MASSGNAHPSMSCDSSLFLLFAVPNDRMPMGCTREHEEAGNGTGERACVKEKRGVVRAAAPTIAIPDRETTCRSAMSSFSSVLFFLNYSLYDGQLSDGHE